MNRGILLDTDVLIDYSRRRPEAVEFFGALEQPPAVSAITIAELYTGVREGRERQALEDLTDWLEIVGVSKEIAQLGGLFRREFLKSHGVGLGDAIIAATAEMTEKRIVTLNRKHFPMLSEILVPYTRS